MKQDMSKRFSLKPFPTLSNQLPKIYLHFQNQKIYYETQYIWF